MSEQEEKKPRFDGIEDARFNFFTLPRQWIDICAEIDSLTELKVVQYVLRHTWGFQEYDDTPKHIVIRLISWRISAMINAQDCLEKSVERIFDENLCHNNVPRHCSSSFSYSRIKGKITSFVTIKWRTCIMSGF